LVVIAVNVIDGLHFDDPVGAIAVHGVNGTFGALAIGLFAEKEGLFFGGGWHLLQVQTIGTLAVSVWAFVTTYILFKVLHATVGIRVSEEDEIEGMDVSEHGVPAYNEQGSMGTTGFSINDLTSNYAGLNEN
jgi:Amt family ammonium transporter